MGGNEDMVRGLKGGVMMDLRGWCDFYDGGWE